MERLTSVAFPLAKGSMEKCRPRRTESPRLPWFCVSFGRNTALLEETNTIGAHPCIVHAKSGFGWKLSRGARLAMHAFGLPRMSSAGHAEAHGITLFRSQDCVRVRRLLHLGPDHFHVARISRTSWCAHFSPNCRAEVKSMQARDSALLERIFEMRSEQLRCTLTRSGRWRQVKEAGE